MMHDDKREDSMFESLHHWWRRRKWLAILVFAVSFSALAGFVSALPDIYHASATVLLNMAGTQASSAQVSAEGVQDNQLDSVSEEVLSRTRLQGLITRFDLYPELRKSSSPEQIIERMRRDIQLERKSGEQQWGRDPTFAFTISYQGWDPQTVAQVTNALVSSYVDENNSIRARQAVDTANSLQAQMAGIKQKLDSQEQLVNTFRNTHTGELPEQQQANLATLAQLNEQLHQNSDNQTQAMQRREALLKEMADSGDADVTQLEQELASLRTRYTDMYPDIVRVKAQIAAMKRQQAQDSSDGNQKPLSPLQQQFQAVAAELTTYKEEGARLRAEIVGYQNRVDNIPLRAQQLNTLSLGYAETRDVYTSLMKNYEQARLAQASQSQNPAQYRILDPAVVPLESAGPARMRLMLMAMMFCLGLAAVAVYVAEQMDTSFHSVKELRSFSRVPVLAAIPLIVTRGDAWRSRLRFGAAAVAALLLAVMAVQAAHFVGHGNEQLVWMLAHHS